MDNVKVVPESFKSSHKFGHDPLTEALWESSMVQGQDDTAGESDGPAGWNALFHFGSGEDIEILGATADGTTYPEATVTVPRGSYILTADSQGFVYTARYDYQSEDVAKDWFDIQELAYPEDEDEF